MYMNFFLFFHQPEFFIHTYIEEICNGCEQKEEYVIRLLSQDGELWIMLVYCLYMYGIYTYIL